MSRRRKALEFISFTNSKCFKSNLGSETRVLSLKSKFDLATVVIKIFKDFTLLFQKKTKVLQMVTTCDWVSLHHMTYSTLPLVFFTLAILDFPKSRAPPFLFFQRPSFTLWPQLGLPPLVHPYPHTVSTHQSSFKGYFLKEQFTNMKTKSNSPSLSP